jgi:hypothetical protein
VLGAALAAGLVGAGFDVPAAGVPVAGAAAGPAAGLAPVVAGAAAPVVTVVGLAPVVAGTAAPVVTGLVPVVAGAIVAGAGFAPVAGAAATSGSAALKPSAGKARFAARAAAGANIAAATTITAIDRAARRLLLSVINTNPPSSANAPDPDEHPHDHPAYPSGGFSYVNPRASVVLCPSGLVTTTSTPLGVGACGAVVASICVSEITPTDLASVPSMDTVAPTANPVPVMVIRVPPVEGPLTGVMEVIAGGPSYTKDATSAPRWPSGLIATTSTTPAGCAAATPVTRVALATDGFCSGIPPMLIVTPVSNPVPVIATDVPPDAGDDLGVMSVTDGPPTYVYAPASVALCGGVSGFVTTTSTAPAACAGVLPVNVVGLTKEIAVAATPPMVMVAPGWK